MNAPNTDETIALDVGDRVTWTQASSPGNGRYRLRTREGRIVQIDGETAMVKVPGRGNDISLPLSMLRHKNQRTALTEAFLRMGEQLNEQ